MSDVLGRALGEKLSPVFGRNFIVENRAGAGGTLGATSVARAAPDGHTLLIGHIGILAVNPSLYTNLQYQPLTSFTFVAPLALVPNVLVINPKLPVHNIAELIAYAKANPGQLNFSSAGIGGADHHTTSIPAPFVTMVRGSCSSPPVTFSVPVPYACHRRSDWST